MVVAARYIQTGPSPTYIDDQDALRITQAQADLRYALAGADTGVQLGWLDAALGNAPDRWCPMDRMIVSSAATVVAGTAYIMLGTSMVSKTFSKLAMSTSTAWTSATLVRLGLFTVDASSQPNKATLVARTANISSGFGAAATVFESVLDATGGFPSTYTITAGARYGIGFIGVGGTPGTVRGQSPQGPSGLYTARGLAITGVLGTGLTDLPTAQTVIASSGVALWTEAVA